MLSVVEDEVKREPLHRAKCGGSKPGREYVFRDREHHHDLLYRDYFSKRPTFRPVKFHRRFRMRRDLFVRIMDAVTSYDPWFLQKRDALGRLGVSTLQKCVAAMQMLAYGMVADACDDYCWLGESTVSECMKRLVIAVRGCFEDTYLRQPLREDLLQQMEINKGRGFPGMFGSLDCMHWTWKNCPVAWQGQFEDKDKNRSVILEAIADHSLWIWHAFFGFLGDNNDINVLDRSPLVA